MEKNEWEKDIEEMQERIIEIDLERLKMVDPEIAKLVFLLHRDLQRTKHLYFKARESERIAWTHNVNLQAENISLKREIEILRSEISTLIERLNEKTRQADRLLFRVKDLEMKAGIIELGMMNLLSALERMYGIITSKYTDPVYESLKRDVLVTTRDMISMVKSIIGEVKGETAGAGGKE